MYQKALCKNPNYKNYKEINMSEYGDTEFPFETDRQEAAGCAVLEGEPEQEQKKDE